MADVSYSESLTTFWFLSLSYSLPFANNQYSSAESFLISVLMPAPYSAAKL
jgi:hypothetical protein